METKKLNYRVINNVEKNNMNKLCGINKQAPGKKINFNHTNSQINLLIELKINHSGKNNVRNLFDINNFIINL